MYTYIRVEYEKTCSQELTQNKYVNYDKIEILIVQGLFIDMVAWALA